MKKLLILLLLLPSLAWGSDLGQDYARMNPYILGGGVAAAASCGAGTELLCENFDGGNSCATSYTSNCNIASPWTINDGTTVNFASTDGKIDGTYSLTLSSSPDGIQSPTFTATSPAYMFFKFTTSSTTSTSVVARMHQASNAYLQLDYVGGGDTRLMCGDAFNYGPVLSIDTVYYIWLEYTTASASPGADGVCKLYVSADGTKGSADITLTAGTITGTITFISFTNSQTRNHIIDHVRVSSSSIGDNPL